MKFIDSANILIKSGKGGDGHISFRKEKYVPKGGPDGGNGGRGGDIILIGDPQLNTLLDFRYQRQYFAEDGEDGGKNKCSGKDGKNLIIKVPLGTVIINEATNEQIVDISVPNKQFVIAKGGNGGFGNAMFATPTNQTPRFAKPGMEVDELNILLELKLIANVGIVGYPNIGKSTLISVISAAKPKIADYPFTTLIPNIGIVYIDNTKSYAVADIPGLIEGASAGKGLGMQFLRHIERTQVLLFMIDAMSPTPLDDYKTLQIELKKYNPEMLNKKQIICFSRIDCLSVDDLKALKKVKFKGKKNEIFYISSVADIGINEIKYAMWNTLQSI